MVHKTVDGDACIYIVRTLAYAIQFSGLTPSHTIEENKRGTLSRLKQAGVRKHRPGKKVETNGAGLSFPVGTTRDLQLLRTGLLEKCSIL